ncbi:MAG: hypothetical protein D5R98_00180 [Desulfonatronovibrio sp. MSAO_Bac4]|nr:MAG: hypothetical protein D5R98_00180 [Desulfonatronovibrio sp. MSAO_Bac4]
MRGMTIFFKTKKGLLVVFVLLFISILFAGLKYFERNLEDKVQDFVAHIERLDLNYSGISANPLTGQIILMEPIITYGRNIVVPAQSITVQDLAFKQGQPVRLRLKVRDIDLGLFYPSGKIHREITGSGSELTGIEAFLDYEYCHEQDRVIIKSFRVYREDLGEFCAQAGLLGLNPVTLLSTQNLFVLITSLLSLRIEYIQAGYEDSGLIERLAKYWNSEQVEEYIDHIFQDEQLRTPIKKQVFMDDPLVLKINPHDPAPVSAILLSQSMDRIQKLLNLELTNKKANTCLYR